VFFALTDEPGLEMDMGKTAECPEDKSSLPKQELKEEMKRTRYCLCF
jgi:hypothetical protein